MSFRPLTGKLVLIFAVINALNAECIEFPSPYGEVGFDLYAFDSKKKRDEWVGFRPLTGKLVLIYHQEIPFPCASAQVSVPLRGSWF